MNVCLLDFSEILRNFGFQKVIQLRQHQMIGKQHRHQHQNRKYLQMRQISHH